MFLYWKNKHFVCLSVCVFVRLFCLSLIACLLSLIYWYISLFCINLFIIWLISCRLSLTLIVSNHHDQTLMVHQMAQLIQ